MNRWLRRLAFLGALAAIIIALRLTVFRPSPIPVSVYAVDRGRVEDTVVNSRAGTVESRRRSRMSPGISGLVVRIPAQKGQKVKKGDVLLVLDGSEYRAQVALQARSLDAVRADREQACLNAAQADRERQRAESLSERNLVSDQDLDTARTRAEATAAACQAAEEKIKQAQAALDAAQATLEKTVMVAPFDGVVLDVTTEVGEWISPSPPGITLEPVLDLIDPNDLYVSAPLDEADVSRVKLGLPVRITLDAFRHRSFPGTLTYTASYVETRESENRTLTVEAEFSETELPQNLLPGLSADIEVILDSHDGVLRIPTYALLEGDQVLRVNGDRLVEVPVQTGLRNWEFTEITGGLSESDRVVISLDRPEVKAGARVVVTDGASS
jgi:HlyD family secretion protein